MCDSTNRLTKKYFFSFNPLLILFNRGFYLLSANIISKIFGNWLKLFFRFLSSIKEVKSVVFLTEINLFTPLAIASGEFGLTTKPVFPSSTNSASHRNKFIYSIGDCIRRIWFNNETGFSFINKFC